jgi:hypothetical protein
LTLDCPSQWTTWMSLFRKALVKYLPPSEIPFLNQLTQ